MIIKSSLLKSLLVLIKHNLFMLINAKYNLRKPLETLYIQKILKPPTTSFGMFTTSFGMYFYSPNYEFWNVTTSLIFTIRSSIEIFFCNSKNFPYICTVKDFFRKAYRCAGVSGFFVSIRLGVNNIRLCPVHWL